MWVDTGTSSGFGREWAIAALARGDRAAATARDAGVFLVSLTSSMLPTRP